MLRALNWIGFLTIGLSAFLIGICAEDYFVKSDSNWASILGAALGAAITVGGTVWVARYQSTQDERRFKQLIADSITAIRDEAYMLVNLTDWEEITEIVLYADKLKVQIVSLQETLTIFGRNTDTDAIADYQVRIWVFRLENEIRKNLYIFEKEEGWLSKPTKAIIKNSKGDLSYAATNIFTACVGALRELKVDHALPSDDEVNKRLGR